ncbi:AbgT family transporter [Robiginitomaculum antarcticum]|uniref:AbgT family transporter n=1 Tax=Robiginitomaculum antarcticum TaxID=437507 RepID=UPI0003697B95|nr:AbgT family transporter [Robiginitomaculum antarcticum]
MTQTDMTEPKRKGFLAWVERTGNRLPDPVFIFFYLIILLIIISVVCALLAVSATHPTALQADGTPAIIVSESLFSAQNIQRLWVEMPKTFTHFHPLGYVLVVMLGAGVAERCGLFASGIRQAVKGAPLALLTPVVALVAMLSNHAADAGYVVMIPLAAILFASVGRHPLAGIAAAFAGVSGGFSANIAPGQLDALLFGITEAAVDGSGLNVDWTMNIAGNAYFIMALLFIYLPVIWFVTDKVIEPRLGKWIPLGDYAQSYTGEDKPLTEAQRKGLRHAGLAILAVIILWGIMTFAPNTPLLDDGNVIAGAGLGAQWLPIGLFLLSCAAFAVAFVIAKAVTKFKVDSFWLDIIIKLAIWILALCLAVFATSLIWSQSPGIPVEGIEDQQWYQTATPFFRSLVAAFMILFLAAGWAYGRAAGTIKDHRDLVGMMAEAMKDMGYYLVLAFAAAHFVAMFNWSNLGIISAIHGADVIQGSGLPLPIVIGLIVLFAALLNLFVGSASAKWALLAPVLVPMLMLLGMSPESATAAYRVGDGATNIITPLMVYFPLILVFARRWQKDYGLGSLTAMMIPYSVWMLITGVVLMMVWIGMGFDLGPGAPVSFTLPGAN